MKEQIITLLLALCFMSAMSQSPEAAPLPDKFDGMEEVLLINHFPSPVYASTDSSQSDFQYFWKHTTTVLSPTEDVEMVECGAYIFYNDQ